jgi:hypothetical protein
MTHTAQIFEAAVVVSRKNNGTFKREQVRQQIGVSRDRWMAGYTAIFQGMRDDHPGGAPDLGSVYKNVFHRIEHGKYRLSKIGEILANKLEK